MSRRLLILAALVGLLAASCADLPEAEVSFGEGRRFVPMVADATDNVGLGNALAVDADGNPYLSYFGFPSEEGSVTAARPINSAFLPAVQLTTVVDGIFVRGAVAQVQDPPAPAYVVPFNPETVKTLEDLTAENANGTDIAIADDGTKHVVWAASDGIWYAGGTEGFAAEAVEEAEGSISQAGPIGPPSVSVDDGGVPWVSYQVVTERGVEVRVATKIDDAWSVEVVARTSLCNGCPAPGAAPIVVLGGAPTVLFIDPAAREVSQATAGTGGWDVETAIPAVDATSMAGVAAADSAHVSYVAEGGVHVASGDGTSWTVEDITAVEGEADASDVAVDDQGTVYVAWSDEAGARMASSADGGAFSEIETSGTEGGTLPSVATTADGSTIFLSWYEPDGQDLLLGFLGDVGDLSLANPSPVPPPETGGAVDTGGCGEDGQIVLDVLASGTAFDPNCLVAPAGEPFQINFDNQDPVGSTGPHNVAIYTAPSTEGGEELFKGDLINGPEAVVYDVDPLDAGTYIFQCDVHPTMLGTFAAIEGGGGGGGGGGNGGGGAGGGAEPTTGAEPTASPSESAAA